VQLREFLRNKQKYWSRLTPSSGQTANQSFFIRQWEAYFIGCPSTYKSLYRVLQIHVCYLRFSDRMHHKHFLTG